MAGQFIKATIYLGLLSHLQTAVLGIVCLSCENVRHLKTCTDFITCPADETCSIQSQVDLSASVNGLVFTYTAGCRKLEILAGRRLKECNLVRCAEELTSPAPVVKRDFAVVCSECCYNNTCNIKGCGASFREEDDTDVAPYCFDCEYIHDNASCSTFKQCDQNYVCVTSVGTSPVQNEPNTIFPYYNLGCMRQLKCDILAANGFSETAQCCSTDFCNGNPLASTDSASVAEIKECPTGLVKPTTTQPTTTTPTTPPTTTTRTTTTTAATTTTPTTTTTAATTPTTPTTTTTAATTTTPTTTTTAATTPTPTTTTTAATTTPTPTTTTTASTTTTPTTTTTVATTTTPTTTTTAATTTTPTTTTTAATTTTPTTTTTAATTTTQTTIASTTPKPTTTTTASTTPTTVTTPSTTRGFTTAPSTTPTTTILTTPTTTTMATTTQRPPRTIPPNPTRCYVCTDPVDFCENLFVPQDCQPPNNYCINYVGNRADGGRTVNRTCGNFNTCYNDWYQGSSDLDRCQQFDGQIQTLNFECTYCCIEDNCNQDLHPPKRTLYSDL